MNLEGLAPTSDVSISIFLSRLEVQFASEQLFEAHIQDLDSLEAFGIYFPKHRWAIHQLIGTTAPIRNHDIVAIAERISMHYEGKGLRVRRLITDPKSVDTTPSLAIQSFILGG